MRLLELMRRAALDGALVEDGQLKAIDVDVQVSGIALDSTEIEPGFLFAALPGRRVHGGTFARSAVESGAVAILTDPQGRELMGAVTVPAVIVPNPRAAVAPLAVALCGDPASSMTMVGVTGTNGKTTVTHLVQAGLVTAGINCGIVGTLGSGLPGQPQEPHPRTTPEAPNLQSTLSDMRDGGAQAVAMEVSSIALREHRVDGITFDVAAFTGLTQDHLDYHGTMEAYFEAKADLFTLGRARHGVVAVDDSWGKALADASVIPFTTVSTSDRDADWYASRSGDRVSILGPGEAHVRLTVPTDFAVRNLTVSVAVCHLLGVSPQVAADAAVGARIPGRMEVVATVDGIDFVVDYAHTPDAIDQVVSTAASLRRSGAGRVIVVVGAGGDRDSSKRAAMGGAASHAADVLFVTDDNPRSEDPAAIRAAIIEGTTGAECRVHEVADRAEAIERAVDEAAPLDIVLVLGKGHERTQELGGHVLPFDDRHVLASFVKDRFGGGAEGDER